ncbi:MAG TPA: SBBP repeat-containing protein [Vicingaceae bacterium]
MNKSLLRIICTTFLMVVGTITPQLLANNDAANLAKAQTWTDNTSNQTHFIENKGQIMQTDGQPAVYVSHLLQRGNANIYLLREGGIAYQFNRTHYPKGYQELMADLKNEHENMEKMQEMQKEIRLETFRMDMHLVDANPNVEIITETKSHDYTNYYTHDVLFVHHYQKVTYKNIYSGIDWVIYTTEKGGMKYDFIVQPGADPSIIKMKFTHQEELYLDEKGNLIHGNRLGSFTEKAPISFQEDKSIATQFILKNNMLSFALENYNPNLPLTIDPARIWGTYYGGSLNDKILSCAIDDSGNVYIAGGTQSSSNISSNGYQNSYGGGNDDNFLVKFNSSGVRQWATYYGGSERDYNGFCTTDIDGNVYLAGNTSSTTNIALGGHQNIYGSGVRDAFLVKFNSSGLRQWGTYYGGLGNDYGNSCTTDSSGNVYLVGWTNSTNNISLGGHQNTYGGGDWDAFIVKFDSLGVRQWGTYYGGGDYDAGLSCTTDNNGNVYLAGTIKSINNIASGGHQNIYGGGSYDAFLVKFDSSGVRQWGTYYGGSDYDYGYSCATDNNSNVYLAGMTSSTNNITSGGHQNINQGANDAFLVKFDNNGIRQWATFYGGNKSDIGNSCITDKNGGVYIAGNTLSINSISSLGHQNMHGDGGIYSDAFLVKFNNNGVRQWATYYGGNSDDAGIFCVTDSNGDVYMTGTTKSTNNIAFGGHQNTLGGYIDSYLVKFEGGNTVSVKENVQKIKTINIYPNPNKGVFTIEMLNNQQHNFEITDLTGKLVYQGKINKTHTAVDLSEYENGVYLLKIDEDVVKLIKQ